MCAKIKQKDCQRKTISRKKIHGFISGLCNDFTSQCATIITNTDVRYIHLINEINTNRMHKMHLISHERGYAKIVCFW